MSSCGDPAKQYSDELLKSISIDVKERFEKQNSDKLKYADLLNKILLRLSGLTIDTDFSESLKQLSEISGRIEDGGNNINHYLIYNNCISDHYKIIESFPPVDDKGAALWKYSFQMIPWIDNNKSGGKPKAKSKKNNVSKKPVVSQKKQSEYKEILGKKMKIYKMPDSRKQYVRYKGELHSISDYKNLMKQKAKK